MRGYSWAGSRALRGRPNRRQQEWKPAARIEHVGCESMDSTSLKVRWLRMTASMAERVAARSSRAGSGGPCFWQGPPDAALGQRRQPGGLGQSSIASVLFACCGDVLGVSGGRIGGVAFDGLSKCWERGHGALAGCQGRRPGAGASRRAMSPIMAHLTMASACPGRRS